MTDPEPRAVLGAYPADCRPLGRLDPLGNAGGLSGARLWRFDAGRGPLVLRAWPPDGPDVEAIRRIHGWLAGLRHLGFVPVPLPDREGRTVRVEGGSCWQVEPWMPGEAEVGRPPREDRVRSGFAALAALHAGLSAHRSVGPSTGLAARWREAEALRAGGFDALEESLRRTPDGPERVLAGRWVGRARGLVPAVVEELRREASRPVAVQPCLRDARPGHFLFSGSVLTGLVDFGAMAVESPAADLARLLSEWLGGDRAGRAAALDAYDRVRPLDPECSRLIGVFERSAALLLGGHWARWHFLEGRVFDDRDAVRLGLERGLARLAWLAGDRSG